jgi:hypothetical protein
MTGGRGTMNDLRRETALKLMLGGLYLLMLAALLLT